MSEPIDEKYDSTRMITPSNVKKMLKDYTFDPKNRFNSKYDGKDPELQATFRVYDSANRKLTHDLDRSSNLSWDSLEFYGNKRFIDVDEITPDIITAYCNSEAGRNKGIETYEQELSRIKLKLKLAKSTGISPYDVPDQSDDFGHKMRMTMASLEVKYGTLFKKYEERDNTHTKFLDKEHEVINPKQGERIMTKEEASVISDLYEELPKEVTEFRKMYNEEKKKISRMKGREVLLEESIQQLKDDGKYEVVTPLIHDGYTIIAIPEHVDGGKSYYNTEKSNVENLYKKLSKLKKFDYHEGNANYMERGLSSQRFTTRLFAKNGYNFNIGEKTHVSGGHWSNGKGEIVFFGCKNKTIRENTTIAEHEFGHSQYDAIGHYVRGFDQNKSRIEKKFKSKETLRKHYWRFNDEVGLLKEGEVIDVYSKYEKAIRKHQPTFNTEDDIIANPDKYYGKDGEPPRLSDLLPDKSVAKFLEGLRHSDIGLVEGIAPEDVFTDYFMDYVRSRDKKIKGEEGYAGNIQTEMFACLSELRVSDKQKNREKYIYAKIAFPKLVKSFEYLSGYKGFPDDEVTEDLMLWSGFNDVEEYNKMLSSIEVRKKAYEITHYLTYDYKVVENEEESDMIFVKKYDKNDKLIGMEVYREVEDDSEENRLSIITEAEFKEEEHPREEDGKFTDKDGGGSNKKGLVKSIRDISYDMMIKEIQRKLENAMTLKDPEKKLAKVYKKEIEKIEKLRDSNEYKLQGLHSVEFTSTKKNTHTKNKDGFKTNKTEIRIGDTVRVGKSPNDGQPHPMVQARMDLIVEAIRNVWNALPDEYRDGIHILQIHNVRGLSGTTLGKFSSNRKGTVKTLTMRIRQGDSKNIDTLIHTLLHEVAHSIWHNKFQYDEEKVNKFRDGINKLIKESGAITDYVQNDHVDLERLNEIYWDHRGGVGDKHAYASAFLDSEDMSGEEATRYVAYQKKQIETIVANETHSEAFGFLLGGIDKWGPSKKLRENPEMVQEYFKLVKELHDD